MENKIFYDIKDYNYQINKNGEVKNKKTNKLLKPQLYSCGYYYISLSQNNKGKRFRLHRLLGLQFIDNPNNYLYIDHINLIKTDNRLENLRWINETGNSRNIPKRKNCSSKYIGVYWCNSRNKWRAQIRIDGKNKRLGSYDNEEEAHLVYQKKYDEIMKVF
tara:strand:- start:17 stop:499 length:483 start_codon:yes stop_codon:yes gene_type:complete